MKTERQRAINKIAGCPYNCEHLICQYGYADHLGDVIWWECGLGQKPNRCKLTRRVNDKENRTPKTNRQT